MVDHPIAEHTDAATSSITSCRRNSSSRRSGPDANTAAVCIPPAARRSPRPRCSRSRRPSRMPISPTDSASRARLRLGLAHAVDGRALPRRAHRRGLELGRRSAPISRRRRRSAGFRQRDRRHCRHERIPANRAVRPRRLGRDVRTYGELGDAARPRAHLAGARRAAVRHVFTHNAQPYRPSTKADKTDWIAQHFFTGGIMPSHGLIGHSPRASRSSSNGAGAAPTISAPRSTGWRASTPTGPRSIACWRKSTATRPGCGGGAGVCSTSRPPGCSAMPMAPNGG